jgi:hypothetical protein
MSNFAAWKILTFTINLRCKFDLNLCWFFWFHSELLQLENTEHHACISFVSILSKYQISLKLGICHVESKTYILSSWQKPWQTLHVLLLLSSPLQSPHRIDQHQNHHLHQPLVPEIAGPTLGPLKIWIMRLPCCIGSPTTQRWHDKLIMDAISPMEASIDQTDSWR